MGFACHLGIGTSRACTYVYVAEYRHRRLLHQAFFQVHRPEKNVQERAYLPLR